MTDSAESWRWRRTRKILESAMDLGPEERQKYLTEACGGDEDLRRRIEALLQADGESESPLDTPVADLAVTILQRGAEASHVGRRIGAHRLISELDHGGMGTVYLAERADGEYQEKVAIKLIRPGLASHALIHRFRQERQILAQLNHPNIARILDGGMTDDGMPYFVMEFIEGERIDLYCRRLELTVEARLALFRRVCEAVHAAHSSLVVHCDLKPSNILVTAEGVPKLLDFGIARLAEPRPRQEPASGDRSEIPSAGGPGALTPEYASPEQIEGGPVTTASDVYSLGVVLHEILTGHRPKPPPTTAASLEVGALRGELAWIVERATAIEPEGRYGSARELSEDLSRYLGHLPLLAAPSTWRYRARKLLRRRWPAAVAAGLLVASLIAGLLATLYQAQIAGARGRQAELAFDFLVDLFVASDPDEAAGPGESALIGILDEAALRAPTEFRDEPLLQARLLDTLGMVNTSLGRYEEAEPLLERGLALRRNHTAESGLDLAASLDHLGLLRLYQGRVAEAEEPLEEALALRQAKLGLRDASVAESQHRLALLRRHQGRLAEAEALYRQALSLRRELLGQHRDVGTSLNNLGVVLRLQGKAEEAEEALREAQGAFEGVLGSEHWRVGNTMSNLALLLRDRQRYDEAIDLYRRALAIQRRHLGETHPEVAVTLNNLGVVLQLAGHAGEAEPYYREALAIQLPRLGEDHLSVAGARRNLGALLLDLGHLPEAEALLRSALHVQQAQLQPDDRRIELTQAELGRVLAGSGRHREAVTLLRASLESRQRRGASPASVAIAQTRLGASLGALGRREEAVALLRPALATLMAERGPDDPRTREARQALGGP